LSDLKKLYEELSECSQKTKDAVGQAKRALEPILSWQKPPSQDVSARKKLKVSSTGFREAPLPLWVGAADGHVEPPPLCGSIPLSIDARLVAGDLVSAMVSKTKAEAQQWILCRIERYSGQKHKYTVVDVAPEEGSVPASYELSRKLLIPLPKTVPEKWTEKTQFPLGAKVMALFPGTTSFYHATVTGVPSDSTEEVYKVQFEDDDDEKGNTPVRIIKPMYVLHVEP